MFSLVSKERRWLRSHYRQGGMQLRQSTKRRQEGYACKVQKLSWLSKESFSLALVLQPSKGEAFGNLASYKLMENWVWRWHIKLFSTKIYCTLLQFQGTCGYLKAVVATFGNPNIFITTSILLLVDFLQIFRGLHSLLCKYTILFLLLSFSLTKLTRHVLTLPFHECWPQSTCMRGGLC